MIEEFLKTITGPLQVYTDGACSGNPGPGGYGIVFVCENKSYDYSGGDKSTTNNRMEMMGAIVALTLLKNNVTSPVEMITDSQYLKDGITKWILSWKKNGWKTSSKQEVKNKDLWLMLDEALLDFKNLTWHWVKGHNGHTWNDRADLLAKNAILKEKMNMHSQIY
jgi:ribonuclease HI